MVKAVVAKKKHLGFSTPEKGWLRGQVGSPLRIRTRFIKSLSAKKCQLWRSYQTCSIWNPNHMSLVYMQLCYQREQNWHSCGFSVWCLRRFLSDFSRIWGCRDNIAARNTETSCSASASDTKDQSSNGNALKLCSGCFTSSTANWNDWTNGLIA